MSITVFNANPETLLEKIKNGISDGSIQTWEIDTDGDFVHSPAQWRQAWLRPYVMADMLRFGLIGTENVVMTKAVYGVYHGRWIEMLLTHFDQDFTSIASTALGSAPLDAYKTAPVFGASS
jgi:hypothetical protein